MTKVRFNRNDVTPERLIELGYKSSSEDYTKCTWYKEITAYVDEDTRPYAVELMVILNDATTKTKDDVVLWLVDEQDINTGAQGAGIYLDEVIKLFLEGIISYEI